MPLEAPALPIAELASRLNNRFASKGPADVLRHILSDPHFGQTALVSSFGAESVAILHLVARIDRTTPVLFLDTELLFPQTLAYQRKVADRLGLTDIRIVRPGRERVFTVDPDNLLHLGDPDACCALRKTEPLQHALHGFSTWITGRKRYQGGVRGTLELFEDEGGRRLKVNPLAHWPRDAVQAYLEEHDLPRHPLVAEGYPSVGCMPCTTRVHPGATDRSGRWHGQAKTECGIHLGGDQALRGAAWGR